MSYFKFEKLKSQKWKVLWCVCVSLCVRVSLIFALYVFTSSSLFGEQCLARHKSPSFHWERGDPHSAGVKQKHERQPQHTKRFETFNYYLPWRPSKTHRLLSLLAIFFSLRLPKDMTANIDIGLSSWSWTKELDLCCIQLSNETWHFQQERFCGSTSTIF